MKPQYYFYSIADGIVRCLLLNTMIDLILSTYSLNFSFNNYIQIGCLFSVSSVLVSIAFFCSIRNKKALYIMYAISFLAFTITNILCLFIFPFNIFPKRDVASAEGFLVLIVIVIFAICIILRLAFIALFLLLTQKRTTKEGGVTQAGPQIDSSLS